jgi:hypothetical protein
MPQDQDPTSQNLPPYTAFDPETRTPSICLTGLPEGLFERIVKLHDDQLPGKGADWYRLSQKAKAIRVIQREAAAGGEEARALLEDKEHWTLSMPAEWPTFIEEESEANKPAA